MDKCYVLGCGPSVKDQDLKQLKKNKKAVLVLKEWLKTYCKNERNLTVTLPM